MAAVIGAGWAHSTSSRPSPWLQSLALVGDRDELQAISVPAVQASLHPSPKSFFLIYFTFNCRIVRTRSTDRRLEVYHSHSYLGVNQWIYRGAHADQWIYRGARDRNKVVNNWESINTIYSKDHATDAGARTGAECVQEPQDTPIVEESPEVPQKRQRNGDVILCMMGQMQMSFDNALKTVDPLPMPKVTSPTEILDAIKKVPDLAESDMLRACGKLIVNGRLIEALMALPAEFRKPWLLSLD